jgi:SecD/SecF fusion protein
MLKRNLWKLLLSVAIAAWALTELFPLRDIPFAVYAWEHATARRDEFGRLLDEAAARVKAGQAPSDSIALKQIGRERKLDLTVYFPDINIESTLRNIQKRDEILVNELLRRSKGRLQLGLDLRGGVSFTLQVDEKAASKDRDDVRQEKLQKAIEIIGTRISSGGSAGGGVLTEPIIRPVGANRIEVELPGVSPKDDPGIIENVTKPARLDFRLVHPTLTPDTSPNGEIPPGYEVKSLEEGDRANGETAVREVFVKRIPAMTGESVANAFSRNDEYGKPEIIIVFTNEGRKRFAELTRDIAAEGQQAGHPCALAIVLDGKLYSAPLVHEEIDSDQARITGNFTDREALSLANVLNNPLDLPLVVKEQKEVGPSLAVDAVSSGVKASIIGTALVAAFMITFYTSGGLVAVGTLAVNIMIILGVMANFGATMTLPGLAGIVLTIGMAVDANILIFERMREEIAAGKTLAVSNQSGYRKALTTIIDAHIVQLIICGIMIMLGTGPIKLFGVTLAIGVLSTMFSVLITAHFIMETLIEAGWIRKLTMRHLLRSIHVDFVKYGRPSAIASVALVVIGIAVVVAKGNAIYGVDFAGGDMIRIQARDGREDIPIGEVRRIADTARVGEINPSYVSAIGGQGAGVRILEVETPEGKADALLAALQKARPGAGLEEAGRDHIGASIGREIEMNALLSVGVSMLTILVYIAFRFEFGFGVGAMCSTLHDILMTIGIFVLTGRQFSAPMVAAILCIAGYSINETVVVFDRIREELKLNPTGTLRDVVNSAINKVFARTIMTATTTFLAALALYTFGSGVLKDISFTFLVGIVTSTFSAIFIAAQVFYWWHKGDRKHVEAHADVAPKYEWTGASKASR